MKMSFRAAVAITVLALGAGANAAIENPQSVRELLDRVGGAGTADRVVTIVDDTYASPSGAEMFKISSRDGKPCITGTTLSAVTTGLGWYLNHTANVNLSWNNPHPDLTSLPAPAAEEEHTTAASYRYYLNYCTFSYSMSTWTWDRWQEEIDWMALHGINMPLQIIGLEEVWRKFLMEDYGYTQQEANDFVGGPCFMAWFGMNNLQGWGGPNPDWWYERQAQLGKQINERMKSLGIEPVLPGFAGMVPSTFTAKTGVAASGQGNWCGFLRPYIVDSTGDKFGEVAANYYKRLKEVMGESQYYSIDPYHEGGAAPANPGLGYQKMCEAMLAARPGSQWVIQSWQWGAAQKTCLDNIEKGTLIVLDLYSDGRPGWGNYKGHDTVYSTIFNFGGRTGFFGRFNGIIDGYFDARNTASVKGIGAAPEAIEQTPVMYDLLFELPWMDSKPDAAEWMADYARRRYSAESPAAAEAWELLRTSALDCRTSLQGPHEAIMCGRPSLTINKVSSWGGSEIFYDTSKTAGAAYKLLNAGLSGNNYSYDLTDLVRQALTDYSKSLLAGINAANSTGDTELFNKRRDAFLQLILGVDELLNTHPDFMLGHWTERARKMADEVSGTTDADRDWLEHDNARTLITTWGARGNSENGGLRDYSYRQWGGMVRDFYYERWKQWFDAGMKTPSGGWFDWEWNWAHNNDKRYPTEAVGSTAEVGRRLLNRYLSRFNSKSDPELNFFISRLLTTDARAVLTDRATPESDYTPDIDGVTAADIAEIAIDFSKNGRYEPEEIAAGGAFPIPASAPVGERTCRLTLTDGTELTYTLKILVEITEPRTVSVATADASQGAVSIDGTDALSVTTKDYVVIRATAESLYDFDHWEDAQGNNVGNDNPLTYYGRDAAAFTAHFVINKWGVPETDGYKDKGTIDSYNQYVKSMSYSQNGEVFDLYESAGVPDRQFVQVPTRIKAAPGGEFSFNWTDAGGLNWLFLSAYVDLNSDGVFEMNRDTELLGTFGEYHSNDNPQVAAGEFKVLLPYETQLGTTHIRLRFDSSWNEQAWNGEVKCFRPDGYTNRFVYEILLEVVDSPDYACTVTYKANNNSYGSMRSENETMVYNPGEEVIITAFPKEGCRVKRWVDNHGRELPAEWVGSDGNSVRFKAFDNAEITAEFEALPLSLGDWEFDRTFLTSGGICLTGVAKAGTPAVDLSGDHDIRSILPEVFGGRTDVGSVVLPDAELIGQGDEIYSRAVAGDGKQNTIYQLGKTISGNDSWVMTMHGTNSGASFNEWGSALYGNGTNCLADDYSNGWSQYYLTTAGVLQIKWDSRSEVKFDNVSLLGEFTITSVYDAQKKELTVTASNSKGQSQTRTLTNSSAMKDISQFATAIPAGLDFTLTFNEPDCPQQLGSLFAGCTGLTDFAVGDSHPAYKVNGGVAYDRTGRNVIAYPEGRLHLYPFTLGDGTRTVGAAPSMTGGALDAASLGVKVAGSHSNPLTAYWHLSTAAGKSHLVHENSGATLAASGESLAATRGEAPFAYLMVYGAGQPRLNLAAGGSYLALADGKLTTASKATDFEIGNHGVLNVVAPAEDFTLTVPACAYLPDGAARFYYVVGVNDKGAELAAVSAGHNYADPSTGLVVRNAVAGETLSFLVGREFPTFLDGNLEKNILKANLVDRNVADEFYLLDSDGKFRLNRGGTIPANCAYILKSDVPASVGDTFDVDGSTGTGITGIGGAASPAAPLFDLQGRRVADNPAPGLYIDADGNKTAIR